MKVPYTLNHGSASLKVTVLTPWVKQDDGFYRYVINTYHGWWLIQHIDNGFIPYSTNKVYATLKEAQTAYDAYIEKECPEYYLL